MENIWAAVIIAIITSTLSPAILLVLKGRSDRLQRLEDAEFKRQERLAIEAREDAREARAQASRNQMLSGLATVQKQTDGVIAKVTELAKATGHVEGAAEAQTKAQDTAATLALGQKQGRDAERESKADSSLGAKGGSEVPVTDSRVAKATEQIAVATEREAKAKERMADVAEEKKTDGA